MCARTTRSVLLRHIPGVWYMVMHAGRQVLMVHKAFLKRKRPLYSKRQEAIAEVPDFWLKVVSRKSAAYEYALLC